MTGQELLGNLKTEDLLGWLADLKYPVNIDPVWFQKSLEIAGELFHD
jgi:hypothetical protein